MNVVSDRFRPIICSIHIPWPELFQVFLIPWTELFLDKQGFPYSPDASWLGLSMFISYTLVPF
jgi:hypothetical protein